MGKLVFDFFRFIKNSSDAFSDFLRQEYSPLDYHSTGAKKKTNRPSSISTLSFAPWLRP